MTDKQILKRNYYYLNEYAKKQKSADIFLKDIFFLVDKNNNICCIKQDNVSNNNGIEDILFELLKYLSIFLYQKLAEYFASQSASA